MLYPIELGAQFFVRGPLSPGASMGSGSRPLMREAARASGLRAHVMWRVLVVDRCAIAKAELLNANPPPRLLRRSSRFDCEGRVRPRRAKVLFPPLDRPRLRAADKALQNPRRLAIISIADASWRCSFTKGSRTSRSRKGSRSPSGMRTIGMNVFLDCRASSLKSGGS